MRPTKLTNLILMLLAASGITAQEVFFDDVYFSSDKNKKSKTETKKDEAVKDNASGAIAYSASAAGEYRDVDEYNRRYLPYEEEYYFEDEMAEDSIVIQKNRRTSDTEYSERIIRYH